MVFEKSLRISTFVISNGDMTMGQIANHMSTDAINIFYMVQFICWMVTVPIQVDILLNCTIVKVSWPSCQEHRIQTLVFLISKVWVRDPVVTPTIASFFRWEVKLLVPLLCNARKRTQRACRKEFALFDLLHIAPQHLVNHWWYVKRVDLIIQTQVPHLQEILYVKVPWASLRNGYARYIIHYYMLSLGLCVLPCNVYNVQTLKCDFMTGNDGHHNL